MIIMVISIVCCHAQESEPGRPALLIAHRAWSLLDAYSLSP